MAASGWCAVSAPEHFGLSEIVREDDHLLILASSDGWELALSPRAPVAAQLPRTNHFGFRVRLRFSWC